MDRRKVLQALAAGSLALLLPGADPLGSAIERRRSDLFKMLWEIVDYVRKTGNTIVSADVPRELLIGFQAISETGVPEIHWTIGVSEIRRSFGRLRRPLSLFEGTIREYIKLANGRAKIAKSVPYQRRNRSKAT